MLFTFYGIIIWQNFSTELKKNTNQTPQKNKQKNQCPNKKTPQNFDHFSTMLKDIQWCFGDAEWYTTV